MTKMANTPIYGKNPLYSFSPEPEGQWPWDLLCTCSVGDVDPSKFAQMTIRERSGSVVECLTRDRRAAGSSLTGVTALCP